MHFFIRSVYETVLCVNCLHLCMLSNFQVINPSIKAQHIFFQAFDKGCNY